LTAQALPNLARREKMFIVLPYYEWT
jgi:hypothetical protein